MVHIACPMCRSDKPSLLLDEKINDLSRGFDYLTESGGHFQINKCGSCDFVYSSPIFSEETTNQLYNSANIGSCVAPSSEQGIAINSARYIARLMKYSGIRAGKLLDIGCGCGQVLQAATEAGLEAYGVDPSRDAVQCANGAGFQATHGMYTADMFPEASFDLISIIHVIDHVLDPQELLQTAHRHLRPGGAIILATHNIQSLLAKLMGKHFVAYNVQHITYYTPQTLNKMLIRTGFSPIKRLNSLTTYSLDHFVKNGIANPALRDTLLKAFSCLGIGELNISFPFGNIEAIAVKK